MNYHQPGDCACWGQILSHLLLHPNAPILPRPEFCPDADAVAFILDRRLESIRKQSDLIDILTKHIAKNRSDRRRR